MFCLSVASVFFKDVYNTHTHTHTHTHIYIYIERERERERERLFFSDIFLLFFPQFTHSHRILKLQWYKIITGNVHH